MHHAVTLGDLAMLFFILAGLAVAGIGIATFLAGARSNVAIKNDNAARHGCFVFSIGAAIVAATILLGGCATAPPTRVETVEVKIPVAVQPITPAQVPTVPAPLGPRPPTLQQAADAALAGWCQMVAYALKADPLLRISAGEKPVDLPLYPECQKRD